MKFYEQMNPVDRKIMLLKAVRYSVAMEGMKETSEKIVREIAELEHKKMKTTPKGVSDLKTE